MTADIGRAPVSVMHVCGSHEQAIARFGLRATFPRALNVIMGPGCPVCITDMPEVDEGVALARQGVRIATYGDMVRVPGTAMSLADAQAEGAKIDVVYSVARPSNCAEQVDEPVVFFATGFETTAVATAAVILAGVPDNFSVLSAHKYIPPVMEIVAEMPETRVEGFLAAGHAATITGWGVFEPFVAAPHLPVVVAGFEPLDILAALVTLVELVRDRTPDGRQHVPALRDARRATSARRSSSGRCSGRSAAAGAASRTCRTATCGCATSGRASTRAGGSRSTSTSLWDYAPPALAQSCICGDIMAGISIAHRLPAVRQGVRAGDAGRRLHGQQRRHLQDLASVRRASRPRRHRVIRRGIVDDRIDA